MLKKSLLFISLTLIFQLTHAETCPTLTDLHTNNLHNWTAYNIDSGEPLSPDQLTTYEKNTAAFALAESVTDAPAEGGAHCYYWHQDRNQWYGIGYLAKPNLKQNGTDAWVNSHNKQCTSQDENCQCKADVEVCGFIAGE